MTDWCILRCAPSRTLALAASLAEAGFEAWTPVETVQKRARRTMKREEVAAPLMPSFVFACFDRLGDLVALSRSPSLNYLAWDAEKRRMVAKGHPFFRPFRQGGRYPPVAESELHHLRVIEQRRRPKGIAKLFARGDRVRLTEGGFAGLSGIVDSTSGAYVAVLFPGFAIAVKISSWLLFSEVDERACSSGGVNVSSALTEQALPARAA